MPSPLAHAVAGFAIGRVWPDHIVGSEQQPAAATRLVLAAVIFSLLPDLDAVVGILMNDLGRFHNNFMGSPAFGCLVATAVTGLIWLKTRSNFLPWLALAGLCYQVHVLMDFLTVGRGVMLLWPWSSARFSPPIKLFYGFHWSDGWLHPRHMITIATELLFALLLIGIVKLFASPRRRQRASAQGPTAPQQD